MLADFNHGKIIRGITQETYKVRTDIAFSMNFQEKNESIQHEVKDEVRELKECEKKLDGELALS